MKVKAKVRCFVGNAIREKGETFDYNGPENGCLEILEKPAAPPAGKPSAGKAFGAKKTSADEAFD